MTDSVFKTTLQGDNSNYVEVRDLPSTFANNVDVGLKDSCIVELDRIEVAALFDHEPSYGMRIFDLKIPGFAYSSDPSPEYMTTIARFVCLGNVLNVETDLRSDEAIEKLKKIVAQFQAQAQRHAKNPRDYLSHDECDFLDLEEI